MAEARSNRNSIEMESIGNRNQYQFGYSSSESDREDTDDLIAPLREQCYEKGGDRRRTRTCCSVCSCSGTPLWQPPQDPSEINMLDVPWFHPELTRHHAEAELRNSEEGVYLLRPRMEDGVYAGYSLDVRSTHSVKHFKVNIQKGMIVFGQEKFSSVESFIEHFDNRPLLGDDTAHLLVCKHPYPRDIDEIHDYNIVTDHFIPTKNLDSSSEETRTYSLASKEGYLTKMGAVRKSWKLRWFVLNNDELQYFTKERALNPIKSINLKEVSEISDVLPSEVSQRDNVFRVVTPKRTFFLQATTIQVRDQWIGILRWKLKQLQKAKQSQEQSSPCRS